MHWSGYFNRGLAVAHTHGDGSVQQCFMVNPQDGLPFEQAIGSDGAPVLVFRHASRNARNWTRDASAIWLGVCQELIARHPDKPVWLLIYIVDMDDRLGHVFKKSLAANAHMHIGGFELESTDNRVYTWFAVQVKARLLSQIGPILTTRCAQLMLSLWSEQPDRDALKAATNQDPEKAVNAHTPRLQGLWGTTRWAKNIIGCSNSGMFDWLLERVTLHPPRSPLTPEQIRQLPKHEP